MSKDKKQMNKIGFIVSSFGAAIGLGVIWGLPGYINKFGGFYFFILYFLAMIVVGVPLLIFEFNLGNLRRKSVINIFEKENIKISKFIGWFQSTLMIIIPIYYSVLVGYTLISVVIEFIPNFINSSDNAIFDKNFLYLNGVGVTSTGFQWIVFLTFLLVIALVAGILMFGAEGIEKANKFFIPLLFLIIFILAIYILTLPGSMQGITTLFLKDNFLQLKSITAWTNAFAMAFFTTSLGMGMMIHFASIGPRNQDNSSKVYLLTIGILFISITNLIFVFGATGAIVNGDIVDHHNINEYHQKIISQFGENAMVFVFNVLPHAFNIINQDTINGFGNFLGILFFLALFMAGLSSTIGNTSFAIDSIVEQYKLKLKNAILIVAIIISISGIILVFENTYNLINAFQSLSTGLDLLVVSLLQIIFFTHVWKKMNHIIIYNNQTSWIKLKFIYKILISYILPLLLTILIIFNIYDFIISCTINLWYISFLSFIIGIFIPLFVGTLHSYLVKPKLLVKEKI